MKTAFELRIAGDGPQSPLVQSLWMFFSDLLAAFIPVIPFAFFSLDMARIVSISITAILLLLGVARGIVPNRVFYAARWKRWASQLRRRLPDISLGNWSRSESGATHSFFPSSIRAPTRGARPR